MFTNVILLFTFLNSILSVNCDEGLLSRKSPEDSTCSLSDGCDAAATLDCDAIFSRKGGKKPEDILVTLQDVLLDEVHAAWKNLDKIFFIESAGNDHLKTRQVDVISLFVLLIFLFTSESLSCSFITQDCRNLPIFHNTEL